MTLRRIAGTTMMYITFTQVFASLQAVQEENSKCQWNLFLGIDNPYTYHDLQQQSLCLVLGFINTARSSRNKENRNQEKLN